MRVPTHPGEMIVKEFLEPKGVSIDGFVEALYQLHYEVYVVIDRQRWRRILDCEEDLMPGDEITLANYFGTSRDFWHNVQRAYSTARSVNNSFRFAGAMSCFAGVAECYGAYSISGNSPAIAVAIIYLFAAVMFGCGSTMFYVSRNGR